MPAVGVSRSGVLAYQSADEAPLGQLTWLDRSGKPISTLPQDHSVVDPLISPDGNSVVGARASGGRDIWVVDLRRQASRRITFEDTLESAAVWSHDGKRIAFRSLGKGLLVVDAEGGTPELLTSSDGDPSSWSPDGRYLLYDARGRITLFEVSSKQTSSVGSPNSSSSDGTFSPDGKYIAYTSNETGRNEVFVQATPPRSGRTQVSIKGGRTPRWGGKELFFVSPDGSMMAAEVTLGDKLSAGTPQTLFPYSATTGFDVSKDGQRLLTVSAPREEDVPITVLTNWWVGLERNAK
jgi:Tol biopolymer transport system component